MEKYMIKIKIQLENYEEFEKKLIDFLENNIIDYKLTVIPLLEDREKKELMDSIKKALKNNPI